MPCLTKPACGPVFSCSACGWKSDARRRLVRCLADHLPCPFADRVRPSLSAVGVDFTALTAAVHWPLPMGGDSPDPAVEPVLSMLAGLVLLAD